VLRTVRLLHLDHGNTTCLDANDLIIWFVLRKKPALIKHENIFFLHGMDKGTWCPPREMFAQGLAELDIPFDPQWQTTFQTMFPRQVPQDDQRVLLFPGSGNPAKNWPQVQYVELAAWLGNQGWNPTMVLGPVEQETGMTVPETMDRACPQTIDQLVELLQRAAYVVGNDSGPMHLAAYMGIPGLSIFGPTSPAQWGPLGMEVLSLYLPCSPCTQTARVSCPDPVCTRNITLDQVIARIGPVLARLCKTP
jgi:ADP-heptose:LPS heptosyltransferase